MEIKLAQRKGTKTPGGEMAGEKSKSRGAQNEARGTGPPHQ